MRTHQQRHVDSAAANRCSRVRRTCTIRCPFCRSVSSLEMRVSRYGGSRSWSQFSEKLTTAALACACARPPVLSWTHTKGWAFRRTALPIKPA